MSNFSHVAHGCYGCSPAAPRFDVRAVTVQPAATAMSLVRKYGWRFVALYIAQDLVVGISAGVWLYANGYVS